MPAQFASERLHAPDVQTLLCRVIVRPRGDYTARFPEAMPSRVTVTLTDGRIFTHALSDYPGFGTRPQTWEDAMEKFTTLAASEFAETVLAEIASAVHDLEHITVAELTRLLGYIAAPAQSSALDAA
jgi:2-methylcitrate dehydratase